MNATSESSQFFDLMSEFFTKVLPIVGVIVLIAAVFLIWEIIKFVKGLDVTVNKINNTIESVEESMNKLQAPLNTVESLSHTVDSIHAVSKRAVDKSVSMITDNYVVIKDWVGTFFKKDDLDEASEVDEVVVVEEI